MILNSKIFINEGNNLLKMIGGGQEHSSGGALESIIRDVSWSGEYSGSLTPTLYFSGDFPQAPPNKSKNPDRILGLYEHYSEIGRNLLDYWHGSKGKVLAALSSVKNADYSTLLMNVFDYVKTLPTKREVKLGLATLTIAALAYSVGYLDPSEVQPDLTTSPSLDTVVALGIGRTLLDYWQSAKEKSLAALSSVKNFDYKGISRNVINYFKTSSTKRKVTLGVGALAIAAALAYGGYSCLTPGVVQPGLTSTPPPFYTPTPSPSLTPDLIPTPPLLESLETVVATSIPTVHPFATQIPTPALTPGPIPTVHPFDTPIPLPPPTFTPEPVSTVTPLPPPIPEPALTLTPLPFDTPIPLPSLTPEPAATVFVTPLPTPFDTPTPLPFDTPTPLPFDTPTPFPSLTPEPTPTVPPVSTPVPTSAPAPTPAVPQVSTPVPTSAPAPTPAVPPVTSLGLNEILTTTRFGSHVVAEESHNISGYMRKNYFGNNY